MLIYACPPPSLSCIPSPQDGLQHVSETHGAVVLVLQSWGGVFVEILDHGFLEKNCWLVG